MSDAEFVLETTSSAFGPGDDIPWHGAHHETFPTLEQARAARGRDQAEMNERCGPSAWDSHRRIVPTEDTTVTFHLVCSGAIGGEWCPDWQETDITVAWLAGEVRPYPEPPDGWCSTHQCNECAEREAREREVLYAEFDREQQRKYLLDTDDVAAMLNVTARRVRALAEAHQVGQKVGRDWVFTPDQAQMLNEARRSSPGRPPKS